MPPPPPRGSTKRSLKFNSCKAPRCEISSRFASPSNYAATPPPPTLPIWVSWFVILSFWNFLFCEVCGMNHPPPPPPPSIAAFFFLLWYFPGYFQVSPFCSISRFVLFLIFWIFWYFRVPFFVLLLTFFRLVHFSTLVMEMSKVQVQSLKRCTVRLFVFLVFSTSLWKVHDHI